MEALVAVGLTHSSIVKLLGAAVNKAPDVVCVPVKFAT
jgi:hypothetical protein